LLIVLAFVLLVFVICFGNFVKTVKADTFTSSIIMPSYEGGTVTSLTANIAYGGFDGTFIDIQLYQGASEVASTGDIPITYGVSGDVTGSVSYSLIPGDSYSLQETDGGGSDLFVNYLYATFTPTWQVTFGGVGFDSSVTGNVVVVNGNPESNGYSLFVTDGDAVTFNFDSTVSSTTSGEQFILEGQASSPQTITGPTTIQGNYQTQYYVTVLTPYSSPVGGGWFNAGSSAYISLLASLVSGSSGTQYAFNGWIGTGSGSYTGINIQPLLNVNGPIIETASWQTQYYLTVNGVYGSTTGTGWYNSGASASFTVTSPISGGTGIQDAFSSWTGVGSGSYTGSLQSSTCTMNAPVTETASWITQFYFTVTSSYNTPTGQGWYTSGTTAYAGLNSGTASGGAGIQYAFATWSVGGSNYAQSTAVIMTGPETASASWNTQYYLTVTSPYSTPSGAGWYNSGVYAYASVSGSPVIDSGGTHTLEGWGGGASGSGLTSNAILMNSPVTAVASWLTTGGGGGGGNTTYTATLTGVYYDDQAAAQTATTKYNLIFVNGTIDSGYLTSTVGNPSTVTIHSTTAFVQLTWNASSTENYTRVYSFNPQLGNTYNINLYIVDPNVPSYIYSFSITDFYGMINPYLETLVSNGSVNNVIECANLTEAGGTTTFILQQYQVYTLEFVCQQGTYSQSFTASILGTPGQLPVSLETLAGNFPISNSTGLLTAQANRASSSVVTVSYYDPTGNTSWVYVQITHQQGTNQIIDYTTNSTNGGSTQSFTWSLAAATTSYLVNVQSSSGGQPYSWNLNAPAPQSMANPFAGLFDWLGQQINTLPNVQTGWPVGTTSADIAQIIAALIIVLFLCIGSFRSAGVCCVLAWIIYGVMLYLGWMTITVYTIPQFALTGFVAVLIVIDESKQVTRET
jgi:hypothetical protein